MLHSQFLTRLHSHSSFTLPQSHSFSIFKLHYSTRLAFLMFGLPILLFASSPYLANSDRSKSLSASAPSLTFPSTWNILQTFLVLFRSISCIEMLGPYLHRFTLASCHQTIAISLQTLFCYSSIITASV